jgi:hypothetical protein
MPGFKIGGRAGFDKIEDLKSIFGTIDFPIELALQGPPRHDIPRILDMTSLQTPNITSLESQI